MKKDYKKIYKKFIKNVFIRTFKAFKLDHDLKFIKF